MFWNVQYKVSYFPVSDPTSHLNVMRLPSLTIPKWKKKTVHLHIKAAEYTSWSITDVLILVWLGL